MRVVPWAAAAEPIRVQDYTLTFNSSDGRVWQFGFYLSSTATMSPPELTLGSYRLVRD